MILTFLNSTNIYDYLLHTKFFLYLGNDNQQLNKCIILEINLKDEKKSVL